MSLLLPSRENLSCALGGAVVSDVRASVLECGGPLPLCCASAIARASESARGLAQSKTWRKARDSMEVFA